MNHCGNTIVLPTVVIDSNNIISINYRIKKNM